MMNIQLRIESADNFVVLLKELKKRGWLAEIGNEIRLDEDSFPMDIQLDISKLLDVIEKPVVRKVFGKTIDSTLTAQIGRIIEA